MPTHIKVEAKPTFRDFKGRFAKASDALLSARRDAVRTLGKKYVKEAKKRAPGKEFPKSIGYQTFQSSNVLGFRGFAAEPIFTFITEGTNPHRIPREGNKLLAFQWEKGPEGPGMYFFYFVNHPGTKANPFHLEAFEEMKDEINREMARVSTRVFKELKGGGF